MKNLINRIERCAKAYNNCLSDEYLSKLSIKSKLAFNHPTDREDNIQKLNKINREFERENYLYNSRIN